MDSDSNHSLIDLESTVELECNSIPLLPLPKTDSPLGREVQHEGDNPFDNAAQQAMHCENDPFELVSRKACTTEDVVDFIRPQSSGKENFSNPTDNLLGLEPKYMENINVYNEYLDDNNTKTNFEMIQSVDLLAHLKTSSMNTNNISKESQLNYYDAKTNHSQCRSPLLYSSDHVLMNKDNKFDLGPRENVHDGQNSERYQLSPASFVKKRVQKCIAEARKSFTSPLSKKLDFSTIERTVYRRRSLDSSNQKFSPYARPGKYRKSLDMTPTDCVNMNVIESLKEINLPPSCKVNALTGSRSTGNANLSSSLKFPFNKYSELNQRCSTNDSPYTKNENSHHLSRPLINHTVFTGSTNQTQQKLKSLEQNSKLLADESIIEFVDSDSEDPHSNGKIADEIIKDSCPHQDTPEYKECSSNNPRTSTPKLSKHAQKHTSSFTESSGRNTLKKKLKTPHENPIQSGKSKLQRLSSLGRIETRKAGKVDAKVQNNMLRSRSDGSICNKLKQTDRTSSPINKQSKLKTRQKLLTGRLSKLCPNKLSSKIS